MLFRSQNLPWVDGLEIFFGIAVTGDVDCGGGNFASHIQSCCGIGRADADFARPAESAWYKANGIDQAQAEALHRVWPMEGVPARTGANEAAFALGFEPKQIGAMQDAIARNRPPEEIENLPIAKEARRRSEAMPDTKMTELGGKIVKE